MKNIFVVCFALLSFMNLYSQDKPDSVIIVNDPPIIDGGQPKFTGDINKYLSSNIVYPKQAIEKGIQGTIYVSIVIEKDGSVGSVKVLKGIKGDTLLEREAIRVITTMPKWKPGLQNGKAIKGISVVPIHFILP